MNGGIGRQPDEDQCDEHCWETLLRQSFLDRARVNAILRMPLAEKVAGSNMAGQVMEYEGWLPLNDSNFPPISPSRW
jgi:hypothetical protein